MGRGISIHVPREGHDAKPVAWVFGVAVISIHVPREGHDLVLVALGVIRFPFLSTCPVRGTTAAEHARVVEVEISIHVPREGHDADGGFTAYGWIISIHVPREGHDPHHT